MASTTRGSIKLSTANEIGAALVDVLGGEGYAPDKWEENINICGIHAADIEDALENIEESAGTGAERGSILLSTANAIGATLNKKFNTSRGFKPKEWASAASKLEPLPERTASGAIANITDGADGVPLKNWQVTLPASLDGYSEVNGVRSGKNLLNPILYDGGAYNPTVDSQRTFTESATQFTHVGNTYSVTFTESWKTYTMLIPVKYGQAYYCNFTLSGTGTNLGTSVYFVDADGKVVASSSNNTSNPQTRSFAVNVPSGAKYFCITFTNRGTSETTLTFTEPQIEVGSTATAYSAYEAPTTYTASLGRTIYGGTADIVTGEGEETHGKYSITGQETGYYLAGTNNNGNRIDFPFAQAQTPLYTGGLSNIGENKACLNSSSWTVGAWCIYSSRLYIVVPNEYTTFETALQYLVDNNATFAFPLATPTDFTFTPITPTPETALGVNNFWADEGDTEVTYRKDLDIPDPEPEPGNLLGMNNGNNNENEEESEG